MRQVFFICGFLLSCFSSICEAQIYAITNDKKIYSVNEDYSLDYLVTVSPTQYLINDIAIAPNGDFYGIAYNTLYQIDITTGSALSVSEFPPNFYVSLVSSPDNNLYTINSLNRTLCKYSIDTGVFSTVAYLGYETSGDLIFYKGHVIFQSYSSDGSIFMIKAFNVENGELKDIMCQPFYFQLWGMVNLENCDSDIILASNPSNEFLEINFNTQTFNTIPFELDGQIFGLAQPSESSYYNCSFDDFSDLNCELKRDGFDYDDLVIFPNPVLSTVHIAHTSEFAKIYIFDSVGRLVLSQKCASDSMYDLSGLESGIYSVQLKSDSRTLRGSIIKN